MSRVVEANEPDIRNYQFFLNRSETKCIVHETYANSEDALAHNTSIASQTILPKIFSVARISQFDVYGNPSDELQKVLTSFGPQIYSLFAGFSRWHFGITFLDLAILCKIKTSIFDLIINIKYEFPDLSMSDPGDCIA